VEAHLTLHDRRFDDLEAQHVEPRRHFGVLVEAVLSEVRLAAEGVAANTAALESFRAETREQFTAVDRRFLRLEAIVLGGPDRPRRGMRG
jgi:hypothetical protein